MAPVLRGDSGQILLVLPKFCEVGAISHCESQALTDPEEERAENEAAAGPSSIDSLSVKKFESRVSGNQENHRLLVESTNGDHAGEPSESTICDSTKTKEEHEDVDLLSRLKMGINREVVHQKEHDQ